MTARLDWKNVIIPRARELVESATHGVTLRRLFYLLLEDPVLFRTCPEYQLKVRRMKPKKTPDAQPKSYGSDIYKALSDRTAKARRNDGFPDLLDQTRRIHRRLTFKGPDHAHRWTHHNYRIDRTIGQPVSLYLAVEKATYIPLLDAWFEDTGIPILPCGGYSSQTFVKEVIADVRSMPDRDDPRYARHGILIYGGDFDPSGLDIERDFVARTDCWSKVIRVGLKYEQLAAYNLPENPGKDSDPRRHEMISRFGKNIQVELEALHEDTLRGLHQQAIDQFWNPDAYQAALDREEQERADLERRWSA